MTKQRLTAPPLMLHALPAWIAIVSAVGVAIAATYVWWWWAGRPVDLVDAPGGRFPCLSYAPYQGGQTPYETDLMIPPTQIEADLRLLSERTNCVRTYEMGHGIAEVVPIASPNSVSNCSAPAPPGATLTAAHGYAPLRSVAVTGGCSPPEPMLCRHTTSANAFRTRGSTAAAPVRTATVTSAPVSSRPPSTCPYGSCWRTHNPVNRVLRWWRGWLTPDTLTELGDPAGSSDRAFRPRCSAQR